MSGTTVGNVDKYGGTRPWRHLKVRSRLLNATLHRKPVSLQEHGCDMVLFLSNQHNMSISIMNTF